MDFESPTRRPERLFMSMRIRHTVDEQIEVRFVGADGVSERCPVSWNLSRGQP